MPRDAVDLAKQLRSKILDAKPGITSPYLILTRTMTPYTERGLKSLWSKNRAEVHEQMAIASAVSIVEVELDWTYHGIKAKGTSDFEGDKQEFSGHKSRRQVDDYDRKTRLAPTLQSNVRPLKL